MLPHRPQILLVEDDADLAEVLTEALNDHDYAVTHARDGEAALQALSGLAPALILSDVQMQPMDGYGLLAGLQARGVTAPVLMMTAWGTIDEAVRALQLGAVDYLVKPFELPLLLEKLRCYQRLPRAAEDAGPVAVSMAMGLVLERARKVASTEATVLLTGESGVGKEVLARYLHAHSVRASGPFVAVNCAAIPETLLEATLFGHEKGAFTGAIQASAGKFEQAQGGTLLLDEVTEMPLALQAKLLRVLQERELERVGGKRRIPLDIRVIATSNRDVQGAVQEGDFRADLYYRLQVFPLQIPPLRERREDILPLAERLLQGVAQLLGLPPLRLRPEAQAALLAYAWPGNVRELENALQRGAILAEGGWIGAVDLELGGTMLPPASPSAPMTEAASALDACKEDYERQLIAAALQESGGVRQVAAERLGISARTLRHKLQRLREAGQALG